MLILAGVSVTTIQNGDLFGKSREARDKTEEEKIREMAVGQGIIDGRTIEEITGNFNIEQVVDDKPGDLSNDGAYDGSEENPYLIESAEDLYVFIGIGNNLPIRDEGMANVGTPKANIKQVVTKAVDDAAGIQSSTYEGKYIKLTKNIDLSNDLSYCNPLTKVNEIGATVETSAFSDDKSDVAVKLIGATRIKEAMTQNVLSKSQFNGTLDGDGHAILGVREALFVSNSGTIKNLIVRGEKKQADMAENMLAYTKGNGDKDVIKLAMGLKIRANSGNAGLVMENYGRIENCRCKVNYSGESRVYGGLVENNRGTIINCINEGDIDIKIYPSENVQSAETRDRETDMLRGMTYDNGESMVKLLLRPEGDDEVQATNYTVGGIVATSDGGAIIDCLNEGNIEVSLANGATVTGTKTIYLGGILGTSKYGNDETRISGCKNTGSLTSIATGDSTETKQEISSFEENITNCENKGSLNENKIIVEDGEVITYFGGIMGYKVERLVEDEQAPTDIL